MRIGSQEVLLEFQTIERDLAARRAEEPFRQPDCVASPCLVALVARAPATMDSGHGTGATRLELLNRWRPRTWRYESMANICVEVLSRGLPNPIVWAFGQYTASEMGALQSGGFVPADVVLPTTMRPAKLVNVIVRTGSSNPSLMPWHQGFGHFQGVRIAVFSPDDEPVSDYEQWLSDVRGGVWPHSTARSDDDLLACPECAYGYASPYGEESREHLLAGRVGIDSRSLAAEIADRLELRLLVTEADEAEYRKWEWDYTPPHDVATFLSDEP